jgi:large subunit ribosomal protein L1
VHLNLGLNVRHAEQASCAGTLMAPARDRRESKVAVFAEGEKAREAEEAGADVVGTNDLASKIEEGFDDFDVAVATPDQMSVVGKLGRILGPRGKMPNPKTGTVTMDVGKAVREAKAGKLEYRTDRGANVHVTIGKKSFDEKQLLENYATLIDEIVRAKPAAAKGRYIKTVTLTSTMGPGSTSTRRGLGHRRGARRRACTRSSNRLRVRRRRQLAAERRKSSRGGLGAHLASEPAVVRARNRLRGDRC